MKVGITGTQVGLQPVQELQLTQFVQMYPEYFINGELHHGDCRGADVEVVSYLRKKFDSLKIVAHPPVISSKRAFFESDETRRPAPYLDRNHNIVDASDMMLAFPKTNDEELRSGTWATIRYTKKKEKYLVIFYPCGHVQRTLNM